ncbi:MAG: AMP-binding protein [Ruminococcus sp.]|uniref:AMP-binding protein n=1 Tax=Ruminococcus sp. TaxID=41978 RepID=UPI0025F34460|nr:AMP-binding protein [Ruminococcus sp.]MCR5601019.1 AMP-binding protein [Ruminococcus sp.]
MFLNIDRKEKTNLALIDNEGNRITYGELAVLMDTIGEKVQSRSLVFQLCKNTAGSVAGYLGFIEHEAVPVTLNSKIDPELLGNLLDIYTPAYIWCPVEETERFGYEKVFETLGYALLKTGNDIYPLNDMLQLCMTTSGSTGSPKLVRYKKGNLEANAKNVAAAFGWTENERAVCDLGMQYTMGLNVINTHLYVGAVLLLTTYNLMSGEFWKYVREEKGTNFTGVPFSYEIMKRLHFERMDLPDLHTLSQGGGKLTDARFEELAKYAADNGKRFIASFGTTETSARLACLPAELALTKTGSIGRAIPEGELFLVNENGDVLTDKVAEGEMCYKGPNVTMGYAVCREDLMKGDEFGGVYRTGDLARRDEDGCYYVTGRLSRFLKLLSYRVSLDQCERLIAQEFGIECACAGTDKRMNIYVTDDSKQKEIVDFITTKTGLFKNQFKVIKVPEIIRNDTGKIRYAMMDQMYGEL